MAATAERLQVPPVVRSARVERHDVIHALAEHAIVMHAKRVGAERPRLKVALRDLPPGPVVAAA